MGFPRGQLEGGTLLRLKGLPQERTGLRMEPCNHGSKTVIRGFALQCCQARFRDASYKWKQRFQRTREKISVRNNAEELGKGRPCLSLAPPGHRKALQEQEPRDQGFLLLLFRCPKHSSRAAWRSLQFYKLLFSLNRRLFLSINLCVL